jgi:hypothetical protein
MRGACPRKGVVTRAELEQRVDELAREHGGPAFAAAVKELSDSLPAGEQAELREILLERAGEGRMDVLGDVATRRWWRRLVLFEPRRR